MRGDLVEATALASGKQGSETARGIGGGMTLDDYKVVLYRNQPEGSVAEIKAIPGCYALCRERRAAQRTRRRI